MKKIVIDLDKCIGCGTCSVIAPKTFKMGTKGKPEVLDPPGDREALVKAAIQGCPVIAIREEK